MAPPNADAIQEEAVRAAMLEELGNKRVDTLPMYAGRRRDREQAPSAPRPRMATAAKNNEVAQAWASAIQGGQFDDLEAHAVKDLDDLGGARLYAQTTAFLGNSSRSQPPRKPLPGYNNTGPKRPRRIVPIQGNVGSLGGLVPDGGRVVSFGGNTPSWSNQRNVEQRASSAASGAARPTNQRNVEQRPSSAASGAARPMNHPVPITQMQVLQAAATAANRRQIPPHRRTSAPTVAPIQDVTRNIHEDRNASPSPRLSTTTPESPNLMDIEIPATEIPATETPSVESQPSEGTALQIGGTILTESCIYLLGPWRRLGGRVIIRLAMDSDGNPADGIIVFEMDTQLPRVETIKTCGGVLRNGKTVGIMFSDTEMRYILTFGTETMAAQFRSAVAATYRALKARGLVVEPSRRSSTTSDDDTSVQTSNPPLEGNSHALTMQDQGSSTGVETLLEATTTASQGQTASRISSSVQLNVAIPLIASVEEGVGPVEVLFAGAPAPKKHIRDAIVGLITILARDVGEQVGMAAKAMGHGTRMSGALMMDYCKLSLWQWFEQRGKASLLEDTGAEKKRGIGALLAMIHLKATQDMSEAETSHTPEPEPEPTLELEPIANPQGEEDGQKMSQEESPSAPVQHPALQGPNTPPETSSASSDDGDPLVSQQARVYSAHEIMRLRDEAAPRHPALDAATFLPRARVPSSVHSGDAVQKPAPSALNPMASSWPGALTPKKALPVDWLFNDASAEAAIEPGPAHHEDKNGLGVGKCLGPELESPPSAAPVVLGRGPDQASVAGGLKRSTIAASAFESLMDIDSGGQKLQPGGWDNGCESMFDFPSGPTEAPSKPEPKVEQCPVPMEVEHSSENFRALSQLYSPPPPQDEGTRKFPLPMRDLNIATRSPLAPLPLAGNNAPSGEMEFKVSVKTNEKGDMEITQVCFAGKDEAVSGAILQALGLAFGVKAQPTSQGTSQEMLQEVQPVAARATAPAPAKKPAAKKNLGLAGSMWAR